MNEKGEAIEFKSVLAHLQLSHEQFISMCVAAGCDFLSNIKTIGIHKARQLVKNGNFLDELEKHKYAPANYRELFLQAKSVFQHQMVFNINTKKVQPLTEWDGNERWQVCGQYPFKNEQFFIYKQIIQYWFL